MTYSTSYRAGWPLLLIAVLALFTTGCVSTGAFPAANVTNVELSEGNYEIVATDVAGEASAGYILGLSAGTGFQMGTLALARVQGEGALYRQAIQNLWTNFRAEYGDVEGRDLALVNVRFDGDALNLILYTRPTVSVRADVVEFTE